MRQVGCIYETSDQLMDITRQCTRMSEESR